MRADQPFRHRQKSPTAKSPIMVVAIAVGIQYAMGSPRLPVCPLFRTVQGRAFALRSQQTTRIGSVISGLPTRRHLHACPLKGLRHSSSTWSSDTVVAAGRFSADCCAVEPFLPAQQQPAANNIVTTSTATTYRMTWSSISPKVVSRSSRIASTLRPRRKARCR